MMGSFCVFLTFFAAIVSKGLAISEGLPFIPAGEKPTLIWWTPDTFPHSRRETSTHTIQCKYGPCITTVKKTLLNSSIPQALMFYGTDFRANDLPLPRHLWQHWALFHEESPKNNWILSHEDCIRLFNHTATFSTKSDYPITSQYIKDPKEWADQPEVSTVEKNRYQHEEGLAPIVYVQRDCNPPSDRDRYVKELMKYIEIDSYGPCLNNKKLPENINGFDKFDSPEFFSFLAKYKFNIAFENAVCDGYMTEKLFRPLKIGSVPIYLGSPSVRDWLPNNHSAILASEFSGPKQLGNFLNDLNHEDEVYNTYLLHKKPGGIYNKALLIEIERRGWRILGEWDSDNFGHRMYAGYECHVCDRLYEWNETFSKHLNEPQTNPLPASKSADSSHLGCPEPKPLIPQEGHFLQSFPYWQGLREAKVLHEMILNKETDSTKFIGKYLKLSTDKYYVPIKDEL